jgi:hypothetical protein
MGATYFQKRQFSHRFRRKIPVTNFISSNNKISSFIFLNFELSKKKWCKLKATWTTGGGGATAKSVYLSAATGKMLVERLLLMNKPLNPVWKRHPYLR